jgi:hypothetical protein
MLLAAGKDPSASPGNIREVVVPCHRPTVKYLQKYSPKNYPATMVGL